MKKVNRRTTTFIDITFEDENGLAVVPDSATAKIHDRETEIVIREATALVDLAADMSIIVTDDENEIITESTELEVHVLTIEFDYTNASGDNHGTAEYEFMVENLQGVEAV